MIVLDTNVLSELLEPTPDPAVVAWMDQQDGDDLYLTTVTVGELRAGVAVLPRGRRREKLHGDVELHVTQTFADRLLSFDVASTETYAAVHERRRRRGRPIDNTDAQIAAICLKFGAVIATRNVTDFEDTGLHVINPWVDAG